MTDDESQAIATIDDTQVQEQRLIAFQGDDLTAAQTIDGDIYISIPGMAAALGLVLRSQINRIQRTPTLAKGLRKIRLSTAGGVQLVNCLRVDRVALWIAGLETNRIKPEHRAKIEAYQDDLAVIATRLFMQHMGVDVPIVSDTQIAEMLSRLDRYEATLETVVMLLERIATQTDRSVELLSLLTAHLTPAQKERIQHAVNRIVDDSAGLPGAMTHMSIYAALKRRFSVGSYGEIAPDKFEDAMQYLRSLWKSATAGQVPEQTTLF